MQQTAEGVNTTRVIAEHAGQMGCSMPVADAVYAVLYDGLAPEAALGRIVGRRPATADTRG